MTSRVNNNNSAISNGHHSTDSGSGNPLTARRTLSEPDPAQTLTDSWSINDTRRMGVQLTLPLPTLLYGLGTTGSRVVQAMVNRLVAEIGRVPESCNYLLIDGAERQPGMDRWHHVSLGVAGCETQPTNGRRTFDRHWKQLHHAVLEQLDELVAFDPPLSARKSPIEAVSFTIFAGAGGSSGGFLQRMIDLVHAVRRCKRIDQPYVNVVLIGPDITTRDINRHVLPEQQRIIYDTYHSNLTKLLADKDNPGIVEERLPDGSVLSIPASERVRTISVEDQSNGLFEYSTNDDFIEMLGKTYFLSTFTEIAKHEMDREADQRGSGAKSPGNTSPERNTP